MPEYTFACKCGVRTSLICSVSKYESLMGVVRGELSPTFAPEGVVVCDGCGANQGLRRDAVSDMQSGHTEKQMFFGDLAPKEVAGKGGYSRERKRILDEAGLQPKGKTRKPRRAKGPSVYFRRNA